MSSHPTDFRGSVHDAIRDAIVERIPGAVVDVQGGAGHYTIAVTSASFAGKSMLETQRAVYASIAHLMSGERAPVHAVDSLKTHAPSTT